MILLKSENQRGKYGRSIVEHRRVASENRSDDRPESFDACACEETIQKSLNDAGLIATEAALKYLDTDGSAIEIAGDVMRTKGEQPKAYQTPYGEVVVERHVYQRSGGGKTYCPLEREGRIIITSTPLFAKQVSSKLAHGSARDVQRDKSGKS